MTQESDLQAPPAARDRAAQEPTDDEAERAAAQFRAAWQTQIPPPSAPASPEVSASDGVSSLVETTGDVAAHPIVAIAPEEGSPPAPAVHSASLLGRTMVGVPPPASELVAAALEPAAPQAPARGLNRTMIGLAMPAPAAGPEPGGAPHAAPHSAGPAPPSVAPPPHAPTARHPLAGAWQNPPAPAPSTPRRAASFPPPAADAGFDPEPRPGRISVRPHVISAWDLGDRPEKSRRKASPALIVLVVASLALLILVATRFLGSDSESTTTGAPSRTEAVLAEDEAAETTRTPNTRVQSAKPGSSVEPD
ncbi:MAG TPA: hypothetical protein VI072_13150 [Polyangiaceae bacterium]